MRQAPVDWSEVDTVLLDMDGTLLDLRFDNWFWQFLVPKHYAAANRMSEDEARNVLAPKFEVIAHTLPWYCIDYWTAELNLDIRALTRAHHEQIMYLPGAHGFLERLRATGKRVVLVTNSHPDLLLIKDEKVGFKRYFDALYSTHDFELPKEHAEFWPRLIGREKFARERTLFVDDSLPVLKSARGFGIAQIRAVRKPESHRPPRAIEEFDGVDAVAELI